ELRIGVQRVAVARQAVGEGLVLTRRVGDDVVGLAVGGLVAGRRAAVAAPAAFAADEHGRAGAEQRVAGLGVDRLRLGHDHRARALVVDAGDAAHGAGRALDRDLAVEADRLLAVHEHRPVELADLGDGARAAGTGDDGERRQYPLL